jgi:hypothetical protein
MHTGQSPLADSTASGFAHRMQDVSDDTVKSRTGIELSQAEEDRNGTVQSTQALTNASFAVVRRGSFS